MLGDSEVFSALSAISAVEWIQPLSASRNAEGEGQRPRSRPGRTVGPSVRGKPLSVDRLLPREAYKMDNAAVHDVPDGLRMITMKNEFDVIIEQDSEGYFVATVPALKGCHTQAKSLDELMQRVKEAILLYLEVEGPTPESLEFVGVQRIRVA